MNTSVLWLIAWVICVPTTYLIVRESSRKTFGKWTQSDRIFWIGISLLYGPFVFVAVIVVGLGLKFSRTDWANREVRW